MKRNIKQPKKFFVIAVVSLTVLGIWLYCFISVNKKWVATKVTTVSPLEGHVIDGVEYTLLQSVIAKPTTAMKHYGVSDEYVTDSKINPMASFGWECKVLAVQIKLKNLTDTPKSITECFLNSAETDAWSNGISSPNLEYYNPSFETEQIDPQGELVVVYPYHLYPNHFNASDWDGLNEKKFYLVSNSLYPEKTQFDCAPVFLN